MAKNRVGGMSANREDEGKMTRTERHQAITLIFTAIIVESCCHSCSNGSRYFPL